MANLRCVQIPSIQTLPAEPAGDVMVHKSISAQTAGPSVC